MVQGIVRPKEALPGWLSGVQPDWRLVEWVRSSSYWVDWLGLPQGPAMLVLSRKVGQRILIGDNIAVTVVRVAQGAVRIGVEAPNNMTIVREEIQGAEESPLEEEKLAGQ